MPSDGDITWFFVTGFPKSGNKWFQKMLLSFESVGGFNKKPEDGLPLLASSLVDNKPLAKVLRAEGVPFESFVKRLYYPGFEQPLNWTPSRLPAVREVLAGLIAHSKKMSRGRATEAHYAHVIDAHAQPRVLFDRWRAVGLPGMHTPISHVRRLLPSFRIVHLLRDPRDVVVSYFYHQISTLTEETALEFVRLNRSGRVEMRPRWKRPFTRRIKRWLRKFYSKSMPGDDADQGMVLRVRYEDLLSDCEKQLADVLRFLNVSEAPQRIRRVIDRHSFETRTGSSDEQRGSLRRKGQSGDWRNYFDRELLEYLGDSFIDLVTDLGYEADASWADEVPDQPPKPWDFSRFLIKRSTVRQFVRYWEKSPELRERYPDPWAFDVEPSFYGWLRQCEHNDVRRWFNLALQIQEAWSVDVVEAKPQRGRARNALARLAARRGGTQK